MTECTVIPEQLDDYTDAEFETATERVQAARRQLLKSDAARRAHDALVTVIGERVARRRASLAELRKAIGLTQAELAAALGIDQAEVSKVERRSNLQLATLERFIEATGGTLRVSAVYGDVEVQLSLGDLLTEEPGSETSGGERRMTAKRAPKTVRRRNTARNVQNQSASATLDHSEEKTVAKKAIHVTPHKDGWAVTREGSKRASSVHTTQREAAKAGRASARKERTEFVLHGRNGQIREKDSYGNDPNPPKG